MKIDVEANTAEVERAIRNTIKAIKRPRNQYEKMAKKQVDLAEERIFQSKTDAEGDAWAPWSYATLRSRQRDGTASNGLLYKTGLLGGSFYTNSSNSKMVAGNSAPYARVLQFGRVSPTAMPPRPFLAWGEETSQDAVEDFGEYIEKAWHK